MRANLLHRAAVYRNAERLCIYDGSSPYCDGKDTPGRVLLRSGHHREEIPGGSLGVSGDDDNNLIVQSIVRKFIKSKGAYNLGSDLFEAVSNKVKDILLEAMMRTKANERKTVQGRDV